MSVGLLLSFILASQVACRGYQANPAHRSQFTGAAFIGSDRAWLTTFADGGILRTEDGGKSWIKVSIEGVRVDQVAFINEQQGWAVSEGGKVWRTINGGHSWSPIGEVTASTEARYLIAKQMYFKDDKQGWIVDAFSVWCTTTGGLNWNRCFSPKGSDADEGWPQRYAHLNSEIAWVSASNGKAYRTRDGGRSWQKKEIAREADFTAICFVDEQMGWLGGWPNGGIYHTTDGGETWQLQLAESGGNKLAVDSLHFINRKEGWAVGRIWPADPAHNKTRGLVLHTVDGGETWQAVEGRADELFYSQVYFTDNRHGWLISRDNVYRTEDSGKSWLTVLKLPSI